MTININSESNKVFNRLKFVKNISSKYKIDLDRLLDALLDAQVSLKRITQSISVSNKEYAITRIGVGPILTRYGRFYQITFKVDDNWGSYFVIAKCEFDKSAMLPKFKKNVSVFLRIDSGCSSGQLFGDLTCECREQLDSAMEMLSKQEQGLIIHIPSQDGRGKGIDFKLASLYLQEQLGLDTTESFTLLEKDDSLISLDCRDYYGVVGILKFFDINSVVIYTNNPKKLEILKENNISFKIESLAIDPTELTLKHLKAKEEVLGHDFNGEKNERLFREDK